MEPTNTEARGRMTYYLEFSHEKFSSLMAVRQWTPAQVVEFLELLGSPNLAVTRQTVHAWQSGLTKPPMDALPVFMKLFNIKDPIKDLFDRRDVN